MLHAPGEHGPNAQLPTDCLRIHLASLVAKHRAPRHHAQLRQRREVVDQAFGEPVRQIFEILILAGIDERQHRERIDAFVSLAGVDAGARGAGAGAGVRIAAAERRPESRSTDCPELPRDRVRRAPSGRASRATALRSAARSRRSDSAPQVACAAPSRRAVERGRDARSVRPIGAGSTVYERREHVGRRRRP